MRKLFFGGILVFALAFLSTVASAAEPFVVKDGQWFRQSEGELTEAPTPNGGEPTDAGWIHWLFVDPDVSDEAKGAERGMYFYVEETEKYSFLPIDAGVNIDGVFLSPNGERFILQSPSKEFEDYEIGYRTLEMYAFTDKKPVFRTEKAADAPFWIDAARFVYTRFEPGTSRGRSDDYPNEWMSASMFDTISGEETVLKKATKTSNFSVGVMENVEGEWLMLVIDDDGIRLTETYVDSPKDWADPDKEKTRELTVPVPSAG
jgi:hypothetical protein